MSETAPRAQSASSCHMHCEMRISRWQMKVGLWHWDVGDTCCVQPKAVRNLFLSCSLGNLESHCYGWWERKGKNEAKRPRVICDEGDQCCSCSLSSREGYRQQMPCHGFGRRATRGTTSLVSQHSVCSGNCRVSTSVNLERLYVSLFFWHAAKTWGIKIKCLKLYFFFFKMIAWDTQTQNFSGTRTHFLHCARCHSYLVVKVWSKSQGSESFLRNGCVWRPKVGLESRCATCCK